MTILVMIDAVDLGNLQSYRAHIERLAERYGPKVWSVIYQGDVRCRLEHMERLKRTLKSDHDKAVAAGGGICCGHVLHQMRPSGVRRWWSHACPSSPGFQVLQRWSKVMQK
jgi:predicted PP-loop superfamily ATPase